MSGIVTLWRLGCVFKKWGPLTTHFIPGPLLVFLSSSLLSTHHGQKRPINPARLAQATHLGIRHHHHIRNLTRKLQGKLPEYHTIL
jgi:hypothetical protein